MKKAADERVDPFSTFRFVDEKEAQIIHASQCDLLCRLLDFIWSETETAPSRNPNENRRDMRLNVTDELFLFLYWER